MTRMTRTVFLLALLLAAPCWAEAPGQAAIASAHRLATAAGFEVLEAGGNAFDAAVAVSAALAVVEPASSGLGGGGFWLLHRAADGFQTMVDGRETSPAAVRADMFLDAEGALDRDKSLNGPLAAGIPGQPAGLVHIAARYGRLPLAESLAPAMRLAREGFEVDEKYRRLMGFRRDVLRRYPQAAAIFLADGEVPEVGHRIVQPDLAGVLERLAAEGFDGFYRGELAKKLVEGVREAGGHWALDDLAGYRVAEREPIRATYRGYTLVTAPPPSSGGLALATMLHILDRYPWERLDRVARTHLMVETMRRAYRDRSVYLGDPDFVKVPVGMLTSPDYAAGLAAGIRLDRATPSELLPGIEVLAVGEDTTHFSLMDAEGNLVAGTLSVNLPYGSGFVVPGTGFLLNNEMDDFAIVAGVPNAYGLIGEDANAIRPGKRMLSSMTPTFVFGADRVAVLGTPGGSRIITMVLTGILDFVAGNDPQSWVSRPRLHHQYLPDVISAEPGALEEVEAQALRERGHTVNVGEREWGNMQAVMWDRRGGRVLAASDPRWGESSGVAEVR
ncbi:MAG TPA: gamma-glutamyltransferase [Xanthomonadaceae bacterium]|nr:gamma-glutamyltransferase [Xanthomonadaceae bacterium]